MLFKNVTTNQIEQAYKILCNRIDELIQKGTGQYIAYYPTKEIYSERNIKNENWCLIKDETILGIVSLSKNKMPQEWNEVTSTDSFYWLSSLFIDPKAKGNKYGEVILNKCVEEAKHEGIKEILLDCYLNSGFLVPYYEKNGFIKIAEKEFIYGKRIFTAALMKREV